MSIFETPHTGPLGFSIGLLTSFDLYSGLTNSKYQQVTLKDARKTPETCPTGEKCAKMFLYYIIRWVKHEAVAFFSHFSHIFAHKPYQNANPTNSVIWVLV